MFGKIGSYCDIALSSPGFINNIVSANTITAPKRSLNNGSTFNMNEHTGSRVANVVFRFFQLCSAAIVAGIIGWGLHRIDRGNGPSNGRLVYAEVVAALTLAISLVLLVPFKFVFKAWPVDLLL